MEKTIQRLEAVTDELTGKAVSYGKSAVARFIIYTAREMQKIADDLKAAHEAARKAHADTAMIAADSIKNGAAKDVEIVALKCQVDALMKELGAIKGKWWYRWFN